MIGPEIVFSLLAMTAAAFLAWRSYRSHRVPFEKSMMMAVAWAVIIAGLTFIVSRLGSGA